MNVLNKTIEGLECCILRDPDDKPRCSECPYDGACVNRLKYDALTLLKKYQPRLLTLQELKYVEFYDTVWIERYYDNHRSLEALVLTANEYQEPLFCNGLTTINRMYLHQTVIDSFAFDYKDVRYRLWSAKPTEEDRNNEKRWYSTVAELKEML